MNSRIKNQLLKINVNLLPNFDENASEIFIPCIANKGISTDFEKDYKYRIELANYLLTDNENFNFHTNWNKGVVPKDIIMDVIILEVNTKMIKIHGYGIDIKTETLTGNEWEGWLPKKSVKIIDIY